MCGICGYISLNSQRPIESSLLAPMMLAIQHRGPDQSGQYLDNYAA